MSVSVKRRDLRVKLFRPCEDCGGTGKVPGGKYKSEGEVVACPLCRFGRVECSMPLDVFARLLIGDDDTKVAFGPSYSSRVTNELEAARKEVPE